jgi:hypothetical protein
MTHGFTHPTRLRVLQGKGGIREETTEIAGKALYQARFPAHPAGGESLHGKEGVDGSSPSEGLHKSPANAGAKLTTSFAREGVIGIAATPRFQIAGLSRRRSLVRVPSLPPKKALLIAGLRLLIA